MENEALKRTSVMLQELSYLITANFAGYEDIIIDFLYEVIRLTTDINTQMKERSELHKHRLY